MTQGCDAPRQLKPLDMAFSALCPQDTLQRHKPSGRPLRGGLHQSIPSLTPRVTVSPSLLCLLRLETSPKLALPPLVSPDLPLSRAFLITISLAPSPSVCAWPCSYLWFLLADQLAHRLSLNLHLLESIFWVKELAVDFVRCLITWGGRIRALSRFFPASFQRPQIPPAAHPGTPRRSQRTRGGKLGAWWPGPCGRTAGRSRGAADSLGSEKPW